MLIIELLLVFVSYQLISLARVKAPKLMVLAAYLACGLYFTPNSLFQEAGLARLHS
jgi:hypothetical protein